MKVSIEANGNLTVTLNPSEYYQPEAGGPIFLNRATCPETGRSLGFFTSKKSGKSGGALFPDNGNGGQAAGKAAVL